jgi:regulation of enolase protein 1 (concanavalin A-like superfamily)
VAGETRSDDFDTSSLDGSWRIEGPAGTTSLGVSATDAYLQIAVPAGGDYDAWGNNTTTRVMQDAADTDLTVSAGFLTMPTATQRYQMQGLLFEADANDYIRFDVHSTGSKLYAFAAVTTNGVSSSRIMRTINAADADHLRVTRTGDTWRFEASGDGESWTVLGSFNYDLALSAAGVFAGSTDNDLAGPGYVSRVDYFEVSGDPILDEDASVGGDPAPTANDDAFTTAAGTALVLTVADDLLGNDTDDDPLTVTGYGTPRFGTLTPSADGSTVTYTPNPGHSGRDSFTYTVSDGAHSDTATVTVTTGTGGSGQRIDVWYGPQQTFGQLGEAQIWINLLGRVEIAGLVALEYSHNGGAFSELAVGPDTRRLHDSGDFNIDVLYDDLDGTSTDDLFTIRATYSDGTVETEQVTVDYVAGSSWARNYAIDWGSVGRIGSAVQVTDGLWTHSASGLRPVDTGYDRVVAIGDDGWDNYELTMSFTGHDLSSEDPRGRDGGGFGFNMLWNGHTDDPVPGWDPKAGWEDVGSFWYEDGQWFITRYNGQAKIDQANYALSEGTTYNAKLVVEQIGAFDRGYKLKVWEAGTAEPLNWLVEGVESFDAPATGSLLLNAHYYDLTFGDITVAEIEGSDIAHGTGGSDRMVLVDPSEANPGRGEVDVFIGRAGADEFVLGQAGKVYYDDGVAASLGDEDYGVIWDLDSSRDTIRLAGMRSEYELHPSFGDLPDGTALYHIDEEDDSELVGVLAGVTGLTLSSGVFVFDSLVA